MIGRTLRELLKLVSMMVFLAAALFFGSFGLVAHYMALENALELLNYEMRPVESYPLLGEFLNGLFPSSRPVEFIAIFFVGYEALGSFIWAHVLHLVYALWNDRRGAQLAGDTTTTHLANTQLMIQGSLLALVTVFLLVGMRADYEMFKFRSVANAMGIEDPAVAASTVPDWSGVVEQRGELYSTKIAEVNAVSFLAVLLLAALSLEIGLDWIGRHITILFSGVDHWLEGPLGGRRIVAAAGSPVLAAQVRSIHGPVANSAARDAGVETLEVPANRREGAAPEVRRTDHPTETAPAEPAAFPAAVRNEEEFDVIGSTRPERVSWADALANETKYYVDRTSGRVLDRNFWQQLQGESR